jgi:hypothetical protein
MRLFLILGVVLAAGACASDHDDGTTFDCAAVTGDDEYVMGLTKPGAMGRIEFKLVSSEPAPPSRGDNTWTVQLSTMSAPATPVSGASMSVIPYMPAHDHTSGKAVIVTPMSEAGQYKLDPVNLFMPGVWEITLDVSGANADSVVFKFCLPS